MSKKRSTSLAPQRAAGQGGRKFRLGIEAANPDVALDPCLGKVRYESEAAARKATTNRPYFCVWCDGFHTSARGLKGSRRGR